MKRVFLVLVAVAACCACSDQGVGPQPKRIPAGYVPQHLLASEPSPLTRVDVTLGDKVVYLGNIVDTPRIIPGNVLKVKHYWKVVRPVGPGWRVFTLLHGAPDRADFMNLAPTDMQLAHAPATWRAGEIIEDEQELVLRPDWKSATATLLVGLIAVGEHGVGDRMAATGPNTRDRAVIARVFDVDLARAPPPPGTVHVPHAQGPIVIDGALDPGWGSPAVSGEFSPGEGSPEPVGKASAKMTWDEQNLYVFVSVLDHDIYSPYKAQDDPLWKADCIELFIDADGNRKGYVELQVNPNNATFDSWFAGGRAGKGDEAWDSGMQTAVKVRGTPDQTGDSDQGWDVEIAIPWQAIKGGDPAMPVRVPPLVGDRMRLNVVRVDTKGASTQPSVSSWNRITIGDFHALDRLLTAVFADNVGGIIPGTPSMVSGTSGGSGSGVGSGSGIGSGSGTGSGTGSETGSGIGTGSRSGSGIGSGSGRGNGNPPAIRVIAPQPEPEESPAPPTAGAP